MHELDDLSATPEDDLETVLVTTDLPLLEILKGLLETNGIPCTVQGSQSAQMMPLGRLGEAIGGLFQGSGLTARLLVRKRDASDARELIDSTEDRSDDMPREDD